MTALKARHAFWTYAGARNWARGVVVIFCASLVAFALLPCCEAQAGVRALSDLVCEDAGAAHESSPCPGLSEVVLEAASPGASTLEKPGAWPLTLLAALVVFAFPQDAQRPRPALRRPDRARAALYRTTRRLLI